MSDTLEARQSESEHTADSTQSTGDEKADLWAVIAIFLSVVAGFVYFVYVNGLD